MSFGTRTFVLVACGYQQSTPHTLTKTDNNLSLDCLTQILSICSSLYLSSISLYAYPHDVLVLVETGLVIVLELSFCVEMILSCQCSCICFGYHGAEVLAMIRASVYFPVRDELMIFG